MKKTNIQIFSKVSRIKYTCPMCNETTDYQTDSPPVENQCHRCLKPIEFEPEYINLS